MKLVAPLILLALSACTATSSDGPVERCGDSPDCWRSIYEDLLDEADFLAFETIELEECSITIAFAEDNNLPPIENTRMYIVSETNEAQASYELGSRVVMLSEGYRGLGDFRGGLIGLTRYVEDDGLSTTTSVRCAEREYSIADNLWILSGLEEKPASGMTGSPNVEGSQRPWQDLIDVAIAEARGDAHIGQQTFNYFYPPSEDDDGEPAEGEVSSRE